MGNVADCYAPSTVVAALWIGCMVKRIVWRLVHPILCQRGQESMSSSASSWQLCGGLMLTAPSTHMRPWPSFGEFFSRSFSHGGSLCNSGSQRGTWLPHRSATAAQCAVICSTCPSDDEEWAHCPHPSTCLRAGVIFA